MKKLLLAFSIFASLTAFGQGRDIKVELIKPVANDKLVNGQPFTIQYDIINNGTTPTNTTDSMIVVYYVGGSAINYTGQSPVVYTNTVLAAGDTIHKTYTVNLTVSNAPPNTSAAFCVKVFAQTGNQTIDSNQTNNLACQNIILSQSEIEKALQTLEVYPNPASTVLNITFDYKHANQINILDLSGRVIDQVSIMGTNSEVNVSGYNTGIYLYQITDDNNAVIKTGKFSVSR